MIVFIAKKFDSREVGTELDLHESIALTLINRGLVSETQPIASEETTEIVEETQHITSEETKQSKKRNSKNK